MSHRRLEYFNRRRIVYRRNPITDTPTESFSWGDFYEEGTYECYELFRSKAKIMSYKAFKWHLLVLWYLNPSLELEEMREIAHFLNDKDNGFISITLTHDTIESIVEEVYKSDLEQPPKNKLRKIIFKDSTGLETSDKLSIVGKLIGRKKKAESSDIYEAMLYLHDDNKKITIESIADLLNVSTRTIYRNITSEIKFEKKILNEEIQCSKLHTV